MTEEIQDGKIKNEKLDIKEEWEENEGRYQEYISKQNEVLVKIETNETINDFEEMQNWTIIKKEELDIKEDLEERDTSITPDRVRQDNQVKCEKFVPESSSQLDNETSLNSDLYHPKNDHFINKIVEETSLKSLHYQHKYPEKSKYQTPCIDNLNMDIIKSHDIEIKEHLLQYMKQKENEIFNCQKCDFKTLHKWSLKRHLLVHNNSDDAEMFKCNNCDFQTKHKDYLKTHMLRHINPEQAQKFKCDKCSYKTILKYLLNRHLLRHRNPEEVKMFKCNKCHFQTKHKHHLKSHLLRHNNPEEDTHLLWHRNSEDPKIFRCDYQSNHKHHLKTHLLRHDPNP